MLHKLPVIFLFICNIAFAQNKPQPTRFDKFVNKSKIEWAAYASDTFNFDDAGLNNLLLNRLIKKEIKASHPIESRTKEVNQVKFIPKDSVKLIFNTNIDTSTFKLTEVTQILYVENGKLKSYIPWVTPTLPVVLSTGKYIGETFYFNTGYNFNHNCKPRKKNKLVFMGQTKKMIKLDPAESKDKLKEMYGWNLVEVLWPSILKHKIDIYSIDSNRKINPAELENPSKSSLFKFEFSAIDDSLSSSHMKYEISDASINTKSFTDVQLTQDWYYDHKKNIVFSFIREMNIYYTKDTKEGNKVPIPVFKLVFK